MAAASVSSAAVLAATHHMAGEEATAQPRPMKGKCPAYREEKRKYAGVAGRSALRSCPAERVSHKISRSSFKIDLVQHLPKADSGVSLCPVGPC